MALLNSALFQRVIITLLAIITFVSTRWVPDFKMELGMAAAAMLAWAWAKRPGDQTSKAAKKDKDEDEGPKTPPAGSLPPLTPAATILLLVGALGLLSSFASGSPTLGITGCSGAKDPSSVVKSSTALAYNGAAVAWELLDQQLADKLNSLEKPTAAELDKLQTRIDRLKRIRESLNIARAWIEGTRDGGQAALEDSVKALNLLAKELADDGVRIPKGVTDGLAAATKFLGLDGG